MFAAKNSLLLLNAPPIPQFSSSIHFILQIHSNQKSLSCFIRTISYTVNTLPTFLPGFQGMYSNNNKRAVSAADVWTVKSGRGAGAKGNSRTNYLKQFPEQTQAS